MPSISIIVPIYNRADLVVQTIESVLVQSCLDWELVIVDDQSTDNTWEIIEGYARIDPRIRVYQRGSDKKGAQVCRNIGVRASKADLLLFLDSDDLLVPDCVEHRIKFMSAYPNIEMMVSQTQLFNDTPGDLNLLLNRLDYEDDLSHFLANDNTWLTTGPTWRRDAFERIGYWDEDLPCWQDWEQHIRALVCGVKYHKVDKVDSYLRQGHDVRPSISNINGERLAQNANGALQATLAVKKTLELHNMWGRKYQQLLAFNVYEQLYGMVAAHDCREAMRLAARARQMHIFSRLTWCHFCVYTSLMAVMFRQMSLLDRWDRFGHRNARILKKGRHRNREPRQE